MGEKEEPPTANSKTRSQFWAKTLHALSGRTSLVPSSLRDLA